MPDKFRFTTFILYDQRLPRKRRPTRAPFSTKRLQTTSGCWGRRGTRRKRCSSPFYCQHRRIWKAVISVKRIRWIDALEPLQQPQGLGMIGEAVQRERSRWVGQVFDEVSYLQVVLARPGRQAGQLVIRRGVVNKRTIQKLAQLMGQSKDVRKKRGVTEDSGGDIRIERGGKGERLHKNLVVNLVGFNRGGESADAAVGWLLLDEVAVHRIAGHEYRDGLHRDGFGLEQSVQLGDDEVDVD